MGLLSRLGACGAGTWGIWDIREEIRWGWVVKGSACPPEESGLPLLSDGEDWRFEGGGRSSLRIRKIAGGSVERGWEGGEPGREQ